MKIIIVGCHDSGKREISDILQSYGFNRCRHFSNDENETDTFYEANIIDDIYTNNVYLFMDCPHDRNDVFRGVEMREYEACDFVTMTPREMLRIPTNRNLGEICVIWIDNTRINRFDHWKETSGGSSQQIEDFHAIEEYERQGMSNFTDFLYKIKHCHVLYFCNEERERIASVAAAMMKYPDLIEMFEKSHK